MALLLLPILEEFIDKIYKSITIYYFYLKNGDEKIKIVVPLFAEKHLLPPSSCHQPREEADTGYVAGVSAWSRKNWLHLGVDQPQLLQHITKTQISNFVVEPGASNNILLDEAIFISLTVEICHKVKLIQIVKPDLLDNQLLKIWFFVD